MGGKEQEGSGLGWAWAESPHPAWKVCLSCVLSMTQGELFSCPRVQMMGCRGGTPDKAPLASSESRVGTMEAGEELTSSRHLSGR